MVSFPQQWLGAQSWGDGTHLTLTGSCLLISYPHIYSAAQSPRWMTALQPTVLYKQYCVSKWNWCVFVQQSEALIKRKAHHGNSLFGTVYRPFHNSTYSMTGCSWLPIWGKAVWRGKRLSCYSELFIFLSQQYFTGCDMLNAANSIKILYVWH